MELLAINLSILSLLVSFSIIVSMYQARKASAKKLKELKKQRDEVLAGLTKWRDDLTEEEKEQLKKIEQYGRTKETH